MLVISTIQLMVSSWSLGLDLSGAEVRHTETPYEGNFGAGYGYTLGGLDIREAFNLGNGEITQEVWATTEVIGLNGITTSDTIAFPFKVATEGMYDLTFDIETSGLLYSAGFSIIVNANAPGYWVWLTAAVTDEQTVFHPTGQLLDSVYESQFDALTIIDYTVWNAAKAAADVVTFLKTAGVGTVAQAIAYATKAADLIKKSQPKALWPPPAINKRITLRTISLQPGKQYYWNVSLNSRVISGNLGAGFHIALAELNAHIKSVNITRVPGTLPPRVTTVAYTTSPSTDIVITFSEDMDSSSFGSSTVVVTGSSSGVHACAMSYDPATFRLTISPFADFNYGEVVTIVLTPGVQDKLGRGLDGNGNGVSGPNFEHQIQIEAGGTLWITASSDNHGNVAPSEPVYVSRGGSKTFTATPSSSAYIVDTWHLNGQPVQSGGTQYVVTNVQSSCSLYVTFKQNIVSDLIVTAPVAGATCYQSGSLYVAWTYAHSGGESVRIELLRNGAFDQTIIDSTLANTRGYLWKVPKDLAVGTGYQVRVASLGKPNSGMSGSFEVRARPDFSQPIPIRTIADLQSMGNRGHYVLMNNISAKNVVFEPIPYFYGILDGNGFAISDLRISKPSEEDVGLFRITSSGTVVKNLTIQGGRIEGRSRVGALCGDFTGLMVNCHSTAEVRGNTNYPGSSFGGLVGENWKGIIRNCSSAGPEQVRGYGDDVGGIAGYNNVGSTIEYCWSTIAYVDTRDNPINKTVDNAGGIVGLNYGLVRECWSSNSWVDSSDYDAGGIAGESTGGGVILNSFSLSGVDAYTYNGGVVGNLDSGVVSNCFAAGSVPGSRGGGLIGDHRGGSVVSSLWDTQITGKSQYTYYQGNGKVTNSSGKTTAEMRQKATFTQLGWDFDEVWEIQEGVSYPTLRGAKPCVAAPAGVVASSTRADGIMVTWQPVAGAGAYMVFRANEADGLAEAVSDWIKSPSFLDESALREVAHHYWVKAALTRRGAGESEFSPPAQGWRILGPVAAPDPVEASDGLAYHVVVQWPPVEEATHYQVFRSSTPGGAKLPLTGWLPETSFADNQAAANTTNYYFVKAAAGSNGERASEFSRADSGWLMIPDLILPSISVAATPSLPIEGQSVTLTAQASDDKKLRSVTVYWDDGQLRSNRWEGLTTAVTNVAQVIGAFDAGRQLTYWAVAEDHSGNRRESICELVVIQTETVSSPDPPPAPPTNLRVIGL